jgi:hypothetical protein
MMSESAAQDGCDEAETTSAAPSAAGVTACRGWMSSVADSLAKTSAWPGRAQGSPASAQGSGPNTPDSLASFDPATSSWRTSQRCLDGEWAEFLETWPRAGMTRSGIAYPLKPLAPITRGTGSGSWLTPSVEDAGRSGSAAAWLEYEQTGRTTLARLRNQVQAWPTPRATDGSYGGRVTPRKSREGGNLVEAVSARTRWATPTVKGNYNRVGCSPTSGDGLATQVGGTLNPTWVEWLMGYPLGWTDCGASATRSSRKSRNGSDGA